MPRMRSRSAVRPASCPPGARLIASGLVSSSVVFLRPLRHGTVGASLSTAAGVQRAAAQHSCRRRSARYHPSAPPSRDRPITTRELRSVPPRRQSPVRPPRSSKLFRSSVADGAGSRASAICRLQRWRRARDQRIGSRAHIAAAHCETAGVVNHKKRVFGDADGRPPSNDRRRRRRRPRFALTFLMRSGTFVPTASNTDPPGEFMCKVMLRTDTGAQCLHEALR